MIINEKIYQDGLVKYVVENGGFVHPLIIPTSYTNGTGIMNPSIISYKNKLIINIRHVNYTLYHSEGKTFQHKYGPLQYLHPENDLTLRTKNFIVELNYNYEVKKVYPIITTKLDVEPLWEFIGLEDGRLVVWDDKLYLTGVRRDTTTHGEGRMELSELEFSNNEYVEISRTRIPAPGDNTTYCEKNWMPVLDQDFKYIKWTNPTDVTTYDPKNKTTNSIIKNSIIPNNFDFRGSSQVIRIKDFYIAIIHDVDLFNSAQGRKDGLYRHRFITWDLNFNIINFSDRFSFMDGDIEFCCGMAHEGDYILITFSFQDNASFLLRMPIKLLGIN
jgi:hypothetical protein